MIKYMTAGESHGESLIAILEGMPRGIKVDEKIINNQLKRRQGGYGRGQRMKIEHDKIKVLSGVRKQQTTGAPIALSIKNKDKTLKNMPALFCPRPGHADLAGMLKYNTHDARDILERASARETAVRVGVGAICRQLLSVLGIDIFGHVKSLGLVKAEVEGLSLVKIKAMSLKSDLLCADPFAERLMKNLIDDVKMDRDTIGGVFEVIASGVPAGIGSCMSHDRKLDAMLASELISIQSVKAISIGTGFDGKELKGSEFHDAIYYKNKKFSRNSNNCGGIEGGMSTGEPIRVSCFTKPISTLMKPLDSVNINTKKSKKAQTERSDTCAIAAAAVIGENVAAIVLTSALLEKFGGDSLDEIKRNYKGYIKQLRDF